MMKIRSLIFILAALTLNMVHAGNMVTFDKQTGNILNIFPDGGFSGPDHRSTDDTRGVIFDVDLTILKTVPQKYCIVNGDKIQEIPQADKDAMIQAEAMAAQAEADAIQAKALFDAKLKLKLLNLGFEDAEINYLMGGR